MKEKQITTKSRTARQNRTFRLSDYESRKLSEGAKRTEGTLSGRLVALPPISIRWQSTVMKPDGLGVRMHAG